jgi:Phasin protein
MIRGNQWRYTVDDGDKRSSQDRRISKDNRSGRDTRSAEEKRVMGERRSQPERRPGQDRKSNVVQDKMTAIATAHADYAKSSLEANKAFIEKLVTTKAPDEAMQITADHMKSACETFVAEATKMGDMYTEFFKSAFKPMTVGTPKLRVVE